MWAVTRVAAVWLPARHVPLRPGARRQLQNKSPCVDVTGDGTVDIEDLLAVLGDYGKSGTGLKADVNSDKKVDIEDLLALLGGYGKKCNRKPGSGTECNEAKWPDKDRGLVCGECKVLVNHFWRK